MNTPKDRMIDLARRLEEVATHAQELAKTIKADAEMLGHIDYEHRFPRLDSADTIVEDLEMRLGEIAGLISVG